MALLAPFKGLTYNFYQRQDFSRLVAPPYDVISPQEQEFYYREDPHNVIRLILGEKKTGDTDWDNRYTRAADYLKRWRAERILIRSPEPCLYLTSLSYSVGNEKGSRTRWGVIALVRIEEPDSGIVLPHERTFSAHRDDRLKLLRACHTQFSPIFGIYEDREDELIETCRGYIKSPPQIEFELSDGSEHRMWVLDSPVLAKKAAEILSSRSILIADGHHRYETARNFRNLMRARHGRRPTGRSYEFTMMYLSGMNSQGLTILPSHRLVKTVSGFDLDRFLGRADQWFDRERMPPPGSDIPSLSGKLTERLAKAGESDTAIGFYEHKTARCYVFSLRPGAREAIKEDIHPALSRLDVHILSRLILQDCLGFTREDLDNEAIFDYHSNMQRALSQVRSGDYHMAFLLNPTKMDHVKEVARHGLVMPRKSTYFYPKVLSGLVFHEINPSEVIDVP